MANVSMHHNELPRVMDKLLLVLDLSSDAVYQLRKYMDDPDDPVNRYRASMAITDLIIYGEGAITVIEHALPDPVIDLHLPKKAR